MQNLMQAELDLVEEHLLQCLFGSSQSPRINSMVKTGLTFMGQSHIKLINSGLQLFEQFAKPFLKENGYVDGLKLSRLIEARFNKQIPIGDFRMIELTRAIEPWLKTLGSYIQ